ncbi:YdaU family protein [Burkholderia thailandensis]|uniref:YdaU family protein n=1 Tax=Burkholderia thailandensis TaxID=57975 RepID=UPI001F001E72|nr:YdaU family protein [Burkholderia thailandensis]
MNFYKRHIGDYLKDTAHLSLLEHGVYTRLLDVYYTREAGIPDDQAARLIGARARDELAALKVVLSEFFELIDGTWMQQRCEREIHAAGGQQESDGEAPRSGKAMRQKQYRERRKAMFDRLRDLGVTMPFDASMDDLHDALLCAMSTSRVTFEASRVTDGITGVAHNVTATNSQTPDSRLQTKTVGTVVDTGASGGIATDDFRPKDAAEWLRHLRDRHGFEADPTNVADRKKLWPVFSGWTNAGLTTAFVDAAIATAIRDAKEPIVCLPLYVDRCMANANAARASPPTAREQRAEARSRAYQILTGSTSGANHVEPDGTAIDVEANRIS